MFVLSSDLYIKEGQMFKLAKTALKRLDNFMSSMTDMIPEWLVVIFAIVACIAAVYHMTTSPDDPFIQFVILGMKAMAFFALLCIMLIFIAALRRMIKDRSLKKNC